MAERVRRVVCSMLVKSRSHVSAFCGVAACVALAVFALNSTCAQAQTPEQSATEMLDDGLDALSDKQPDLATQLFEQLILAFPGTTEADRAEKELVTLGGSAMPEHKAVSPAPNKSPEIGRDVGNEMRMRFAVDVGDRVFFAEDSAVIGGRARALVENQARWLKAFPELEVTIVGRADDGGPQGSELDLSARRAEAVRDKLVAAGVAQSAIQIDARGGTDPIATCKSTLCQAQNRQVETVLTRIAGHSSVRATEAIEPPLDEPGRGAAISDVVSGQTVSR